jgi:hypothetical protein
MPLGESSHGRVITYTCSEMLLTISLTHTPATDLGTCFIKIRNAYTRRTCPSARWTCSIRKRMSRATPSPCCWRSIRSLWCGAERTCRRRWTATAIRQRSPVCRQLLPERGTWAALLYRSELSQQRAPELTDTSLPLSASSPLSRHAVESTWCAVYSNRSDMWSRQMVVAGSLPLGSDHPSRKAWTAAPVTPVLIRRRHQINWDRDARILLFLRL